MNETTYSGNWQVDAHAISGMQGSHYDLARYAELKGFEVVGDPDDMRKSLIARPSPEDFGDRVIGEINGDEDATISILVA